MNWEAATSGSHPSTVWMGSKGSSVSLADFIGSLVKPSTERRERLNDSGTDCQMPYDRLAYQGGSHAIGIGEQLTT